MRQAHREIAKDYTLQNNTLLRPVKNDAADRLELEIGDAKQAEFMPQAKIKRWDNETNFSIRRDNGARSFVERDGKVIAEGTKENVVIYELEPDEQNEDGGLEIEIELPRQPRTNVFEFTLQTKGLNFYYQPEIADEEAEQSRIGKADKRSLEEIKRSMRPENVVGSYAVYHATKRDNRIGEKHYKTGKAFHIYRPKAIDADGNEVLCDLHIDEAAGILTVTVPEKWLFAANYPVRVDPTFGYTSVGGSISAIAQDLYGPRPSNRRGMNVNSPGGGTLDSMSAYTFGDISTEADLLFGFYEKDGNGSDSHSLVASAEILSASRVAGWKTASFSNESFSGGTDYILTIVGNPEDFPWFSGKQHFIRYDSGPNDEYLTTDDGYSLPDPWGQASSSTINYSIYATYTAAASDNPPTVTTQAVSSIGETTATGNGNVTDDGGATITERGVCWSTSPNPTTADSKATSAGTTGAFSASMTGLTASTTYYVRAYAINSEGTSYGDQVSFTTDANVELPTVVTNAITNIQKTP